MLRSMTPHRAAPLPPDPRAEGQRFVAHIFRLRTLGLASGCLAVGAVLHERQAPAWGWIALAATMVAWPPLARAWAMRSPQPQRAEWRNLAIDSAIGAFWVAMMAFNVVPSALIVAMMAADKMGVGGWRLLSRAFAGQVVACAATWALLGFPFAPHSSMAVVLWSLPFVFTYPIAISWAAWLLARKVMRQNRLLDEVSRIDGLTGLSNRANWQQMGQLEFHRARRTRRHSALLLLDIDDFKAINDRHGHPVGDLVIRRIADLMRQHLRNVDTPGRFGGDEFGVVLVEVNPPDIRVPAERLRAQIEAARFAEVPGLRVTASVGASLFDPRFADFDAWLRDADAALYEAKDGGRNRIAVHDGASRNPD